ncbi:FAD-dependent oxidoreductase [Neptunicella sp. SCSIO 80796]|uniref:FAD-dependent oxidoreductase n=1 Tax=Neptunicella plasticusilytica TaxID=3117012 RepID=UPI003A4D72AD
MQQYDILVVGGGMIGATVALGLAKAGNSVAVIEARLPKPYEPEQSPDLRVSAISLASEQLLATLGAWANIENTRLCPYRHLAVWEDRAMRTNFSAADLAIDHLGHIIENRLVQAGVIDALKACTNATVINAEVSRFDFNQRPTLYLTDQSVLQADWLIGADGANSAVRTAAEIGVTGWQYKQQALGINIKTDGEQQDITWQQFTPDGPLAFLPLYDGFASLVWYHNADQIQYLQQLSHQQLKKEIQKTFPSELVNFDILQVASFALNRMHANRYYQGRVLLIGDAAHTINPLAGQGVNLGFKDISCLLELIDKNGMPGTEADINNLFDAYQRGRRHDNLLMSNGMDLLYKTFSNDIVPLKWLRNSVLGATNKIAPMKRQMMKYALGLS